MAGEAEVADETKATGATVGVLALQGAFAEHEARLRQLGARIVELRDASNLAGACAAGESGGAPAFDRLVLPGGESTVQRKLLAERGMLEPLRRLIAGGMPVLATCAGLILLAEEVEGGLPCFGTLPARVVRNAYGRQLGSFRTSGAVGSWGDSLPMTFIRAPYIAEVGPGVEVLSQVDGRIVGVRYGNQIGLAFHPELDGDTTIHERFLEM